MFFIPCDNWKTLLFIEVFHFLEANFNRHVEFFFEAKILKKVRVLCVISTITVRSNIMSKIQNKAVIHYASYIFVGNFTFMTVPAFFL